ncbi:putative transcriptional regulator SUPERMAN-like [Cocos nucifera]|uniref:Putative transcriptional regulator SUPERMAN-like n=1 Tax=Cocos nucifera TaxID=13894 RepID=A0A8K0HVF5_COCNU|nr:putative transcriptional regulator SUPERMAN-like [Cocos nucifera]
MRKQHESFMEAQRLRPGPHRASSGSPGIRMVPLTPNYAYWEALQRADQSPVVINFIEIHSPEVSQQHPQPSQMYKMAPSSEETITDPMLTLWGEVDQGEEVNSVNPDVTLKL